VADAALNVRPVIDWLVAGAPPARLPEEVLLGACHRMLAAGLPIYRAAVFVRTLHPNVLGRSFIWTETRDVVETTQAAYELLESEQFLKSPVRVVFQEHHEVRRRICDPDCPIDYPVLEDLLKEGVTDFISLPLRFIQNEVHAASFSTRRPGGFRDDEIEALRSLAVPLARMAEIWGLIRKTRNILNAYLGEKTGEKVLAGAIRRGDGEDIHAVIWFCDLRDSTPLADSMSRQDFLRLLNSYFECVLGPVMEHGGEVLRFIGDAALAIFPVGEDPAGACARALEAARQAIARMGELNAKRGAVNRRALRFGIGLHLGDMTYGNIGTPTRIEFTVVGAAANEAARIESLCKVLDVPLLASAAVAQHLPQTPWRALGRHPLRGVGHEVELFTLPD
jgi:adenylate cyclase